MKKLFSIFAFVLLMAAPMANAAIHQDWATDKSGKYGLRCEYNTETGEYKVFLESIYEEAYVKDMVFPEKLDAKFTDYDGNGNSKEDAFTYQFAEYVALDMVMHRTDVESITINCNGKVPDSFAKNDPNFSHAEQTALKSVSLGGNITEVGSEAFAYNENLSSIDIQKVQKIGYRAFAAAYETDMMMMGGETWYGNIKDIYLNGNIEIEAEAFIGQGKLTEVKLQDNTTIGSNAFMNCGIKTLHLPSGTSGKDLTQSPFFGCPLEKVYMYARSGGEGNMIQVAPYMFANVYNQFEFEYAIDGSSKPGQQYESLIFYDHCFCNSGVKTIKFPSEMKIVNSALGVNISVGEHAFASTANMKELEIPNSCPNDIEIWDYAFYYSGIENINLANNEHLSNIGEYAFTGSKLKTLDIPKSYYINSKDIRPIKIGEYAFAYTTNLESAKINGTIEFNSTANTLPPYAFYKSGLKKINFANDNLQTISEFAFQESKIESFTAPSTLANIGNDAFASCKNLKSFDISKSQVSSLANDLLFEATALETLTLPEVMISYGDYSLNGVGLKELDVKADIIGSYAFADCPNLETLRFTSPNAIFLPAYSISNLPKLTTIDFGKVSGLQKDAIINCPAYKTLIIPEAMETIEAGAFNHDNNVDIDTVIFASRYFKAIDDPNKAPFVGEDFALVVNKTVTNVEANVFAIAHITNSVELRDETAYDDLAFNMAQIDSLDWHYGSSMLNPFIKANIDKLTFSKIKEIPNNLFNECNINNLYLDGIEIIGEDAFNKAVLTNTNRSYTLYIPASVKTIKGYAFQDVSTLNLVIEKGSGLTIEQKAFNRSYSAWHMLRSEYDKTNIPEAAGTAFESEQKIGQVFTGGCDDVAAYKAADGWKEINAEKWDGASQYKYSFEVIGGAINRDQNYYLQNMMLNGDKLPYTAIACSNTATLNFVAPCAGITLDHWADGTNGPTYDFTLNSDTVIRIYIKEDAYDLNLSLDNFALSEIAKIYIANEESNWQWVEANSTKVSTCNGANIKLELLDDFNYSFDGWYDNNDIPIYPNAVVNDIITGNNLKAKINIQQYYVAVNYNPGCMDCYGMEVTDHFELNGVNKGNYDFGENLYYGSQATIKYVGIQGTDYRYVIDYWEDEFGNIVSNENEFTFIVTGYNTFHPVIKLANSYAVTAVSADATLGTVTLTPIGDAETTSGSGIYWEKSQLELQAIPAGGHIHLKSWNDNSEQSTWQYRTVTVNSKFDYVATFEKDSFNVVITLNNTIDPSQVEISGEGRYGWGDDVTVSCNILDEHYHFESWIAPKMFSDEQTATFENMGSYSDIEIKLYVQPNEYEITLVAEPAEGGTVTGGGKATYQELRTITATPNEGFEFVEWKETGDKNAEAKVEVVGDATYTAIFRIKQDDPTALTDMQDGSQQYKKVLRNGEVYIIKDNKVYNVLGERVK